MSYVSDLTLFEADEDNDFCRCLERIDLLFQLARLHQSDPDLVSKEEINLRLKVPSGRADWLNDADFFLPDTEARLSQRLQALVTTFDLTACERDILLAVMLPRLNATSVSSERGGQDAIDQRQLATLFSLSQTSSRLFQAALHPGAPLLRYRLCIQPDRKQKTLAINDAVWHFFCGNDPTVTWDYPAARWARSDFSGWYPQALFEQLHRLVFKSAVTSLPLIVLEGMVLDARESALAAILAEHHYKALCLDMDVLLNLPVGQQTEALIATVRDALLFSAALVVENGTGQGAEKQAIFRTLETLLLPVTLPVFLLADANAELPRFSQLSTVCLTMPALTSDEKTVLLQNAWPAEADAEKQHQLTLLAQRYSFIPAELPGIMQEADHYRLLRSENAALEMDDLRLVLGRRSRKNFGNLAHRITPKRTFDDIVLSPVVRKQLTEIVAAINQRESVAEKYFGQKLAGRVGISALFYGDSGTGKTLAAEVLAQHLGVDLIKVDLSNVVNKYVGETEKNLARIFDLAQADSGVLFFDEADALFGKRSETKDAHDRHANIEVSYLLQRLESYPGLVVLATNNRNHLDSAFNRRFTFITRFTWPDIALRQQMWQSIWPPALRVADNVNFAELAANTDLTGANISNVALLSAVLAAEEKSEVISLHHIQHAISRELGKSGRLAL